jgi:isoquinoline 1-oxidoreductase beta subunit
MSGVRDLRETVGREGRWPRPNRRSLLIGGGAMAGLVVAWAAWPREAGVAINTVSGEHVLGHFLKLGRDGRVTVVVPQAELGEGAYTLFAQMVADELGADWRTVAVEPTPISAAYTNQLLLDEDAELATPRILIPEALTAISGWRQRVLSGSAPAMLTGNSTTQRMFEGPVRESAAVARALLCMEAARRWDVDWEACDARDGFVLHEQRRLRFAELVEGAARMDPPPFPPLRAPGSGPLFGQSLPRLDLPSKIDGSFAFAGDIRLPDMLYAAVRQGPIGDTRLKRIDSRAARRVTGFVTVVKHERWVAAVATNGWAAQQALNALDPLFSTEGQRADSATFDRRLKAALDAPDGARMVDEGSVDDAFNGRPVLGADYYVAPALHQPIETRTATAAPEEDRMRVWIATQAPGLCRAAVAAALGVGEQRIAMFAMPAGGSFDIAMEHEVAVQAALIARSVGRPVQLCWSRTEEILRDLPRPPVRARMRATLSSGASIDGWHALIAAPAARHEWHHRLLGAKPQEALIQARGADDAAAVEGARPPYLIPNVAIDHASVDVTLPTGRWRGQAHGATVFFTECFADELARTSGLDPFTFRMGMLGERPALARCLESVTALGGWEGGTAGSGQGLACCSMRGSHIAVLAVAKPGSAGLVVERIVAAVDAGRVLNPGLARQQIESGIIFGLAAAVGATTRYRRGLAQARHMGDLGLPRLAQMPAIEVELLESDRPAGGLEEIGVPPVAPAIANALFTVTGDRIRRLPLSDKRLP